jgi:hypothetical protein
MYVQWGIKASDVAAKLNRYYTYEEQEIIRAAEECGYVDITIEDDLIEGLDNTGRLCTIAEYFYKE